MLPDWNDFLAQCGLTAAGDFGDAAAELAAARDATVLVPLGDLGLIRAGGADAADFLHNLLTNDVKHLGRDEVRLAGLCSAKGRLQATFNIWQEGGDFVLALSADLLPGILKKLKLYVLRSKIVLADASGDRALLGLAGNQAAAALEEIGAAPCKPMQLAAFPGGVAVCLGNDRYLLSVAPGQARDIWSRLSTKARPAGLDAWHWLEVASGVPRVMLATHETFVPQMVNLELVGGVSFTKGCYPGQEIVARAQYLGKVKRRMYRARLANAAAAGERLYSTLGEDSHCGDLVQVAPSPAGGFECLAVLQSTAAAAGPVHVGSIDGTPLALLDLPYGVPD